MPIAPPSFEPTIMIFTVDLPNFPEWSIPFTKIIPKAYMDDVYDITTLTSDTLVTYCRHFWNQVGKNHWQIRVELQVVATQVIDFQHSFLPIYVDVDIVINNERVWEEMNSDKF
jgi:hypothetical protein